MNRRRLKLPLYVRFLVPIILTVVVSSLTIMTVLIRREGDSLQAALRDKGEVLARSLSYNAEFGVRSQDRESLQTLTDMVLRVREITRAEIRDREQTVLARAEKAGGVSGGATIIISVPVLTQRVVRRKEEIGLAGTETGAEPDNLAAGEAAFLESGEAALTETPVSEEIGTVAVSLSTVEVDAAVNHARTMVIAMTAGAVAVLCGILALLVRLITNPVKSLVLATKRVAGGDLSETVAAGRSDELGDLAASFNVMIGNLKQSMDNLHRTSDFSQAMVPPREMGTLLDVIAGRFARIGGAAGAGVFLATGEAGISFAAGSEVCRGLVIPRDAALPEQVRHGEEILILDGSAVWMTPFLGRGVGLLVPLRGSESLVGVVAVAGLPLPRDEDGRVLLLTLASIGAMAVENMRLLTIRTENEILQRELAFAHEIQMRLLPGDAVGMDGFDIHSRCLPARDLGGDFYDFIPLAGGRRLGVTMADVAGKGVPAALFMAGSRSFLRAEAERHPSPGLVLASINRLLHRDMKDKTFVSMFYCVFDLDEMKLEYANAGHLFPLLLRTGGGKGAYLKAPGFPLGIVGNVVYPTTTIDLLPGDLIVYYTDGLIEAMNPGRELFGFERFEKTLEALPELDPRTVVERLLGEVDAFTGGGVPADDLTLVAVRIA